MLQGVGTWIGVAARLPLTRLPSQLGTCLGAVCPDGTVKRALSAIRIVLIPTLLYAPVLISKTKLGPKPERVKCKPGSIVEPRYHSQLSVTGQYGCVKGEAETLFWRWGQTMCKPTIHAPGTWFIIPLNSTCKSKFQDKISKHLKITSVQHQTLSCLATGSGTCIWAAENLDWIRNKTHFFHANVFGVYIRDTWLVLKDSVR